MLRALLSFLISIFAALGIGCQGTGPVNFQLRAGANAELEATLDVQPGPDLPGQL